MMLNVAICDDNTAEQQNIMEYHNPWNSYKKYVLETTYFNGLISFLFYVSKSPNGWKNYWFFQAIHADIW